jgi:hypothetical protein
MSKVLTLPRKYYDEYILFVEGNPVLLAGKSHLECFMRRKGLVDCQTTLKVIA